MLVKQSSDSGATIVLDKNELLIFHGALNEICNGLEMPEFETRVGFNRTRVGKLLDEVGSLYDQVANGETESED